MDDNDIAFAVKCFQKEKGNYTFEDFWSDLVEHKRRRPGVRSSYDPFILSSYAKNLWEVLNMSMREIVDRSKMSMADFARRFCIPYRTLQAWCDGTNECPIYTKLMICEILGLLGKRSKYFTFPMPQQ